MEQKKSKKILIAIIIVFILLIIMISGMIFAYLKTDLFKSNRQLFFKYAGQIFSSDNGFIDNNLIQYFEKQKNTPYEDNGEISVEIENNSMSNSMIEKVNDFNITFTGKVDEANTKAQQEINLNYSDDVNFPINYKLTGDIIGLQTECVTSKYIAIDNQNLDENTGILEGLGIQDTQSLQDNLKSFQNVKFTDEELKHLISVYIPIIEEQVQDENFTRLTSNNQIGYKLTLSNEELIKLFESILETLKNDEMMLDKINQYMSSFNLSEELNEETINTAIEDLNNKQLIDKNLEIIIYQNDKKSKQITVNVNDKIISIEKSESSNEIQYSVEITTYEEDMPNSKVTFVAKFTGLQEQQEVNENYELDIQYNLENNINEDKNLDIRYDDEENNQESSSGSVSDEKQAIKKLVNDIKSNKLISTTTDANVISENNTSGIIETGEEKITDTDIEEALNSKTFEIYQNMRLEKISDTQFKITFSDTKDVFVIDNTGKVVEEPEQNNNSDENNVNENNIDNENETSEENTENIENSDVQNDDKNNSEFTVKYKYYYTNNVKFTDSVDIEDLTKNNAIILTGRKQETITKVLEIISKAIESTNEKQMEQLGLSAMQNPIFYVLPTYTFSNSENNGLLGEEPEQAEVVMYNEKLEIYQGSNLKGATVKGLLTTIESINEDYDNNDNMKMKEINFDGEEYDITEQNITLLKSNINVEDLYKVEFEKDENTGLIYRAVVNKK